MRIFRRCGRCGAGILGDDLPSESVGCHEEPSAGGLVLITGSYSSPEAVLLQALLKRPGSKVDAFGDLRAVGFPEL